VLNASAKSPNGKIAEAVATILPNLSPFLGRSWHNSKLAKAVADHPTKFFSASGGVTSEVRVAALMVLEARCAVAQ